MLLKRRWKAGRRRAGRAKVLLSRIRAATALVEFASPPARSGNISTVPSLARSKADVEVERFSGCGSAGASPSRAFEFASDLRRESLEPRRRLRVQPGGESPALVIKENPKPGAG